MRYGENPHQKAAFFGNLDELFEQLNGKELSYNNLVDVDAAMQLIRDAIPQPPEGGISDSDSNKIATVNTEVIFAIIK